MIDEPLSTQDLQTLDRILIGLCKIKDAIERINELSAESGLEIRQIETLPLGLVGNDISRLHHAHKMILASRQAEAMERMVV